MPHFSINITRSPPKIVLVMIWASIFPQDETAVSCWAHFCDRGFRGLKFRVLGLRFIEIVKGLGANNVLSETF